MQAFRYTEMLNMIQAGKLTPQNLIERTISLEQAADELPAMDKFQNHGVVVINRF